MSGAHTPTTSAEDTLRFAREWAEQDPDPVTRAETQELIGRAATGDVESVARLAADYTGRLAFGTAGLRAEIGAGPLRMNRMVVSQTSAGFARYLLERGSQRAGEAPSIVIGYDARVNSDVFARDTAELMAGAGLRVFLLPEALPTPVTAFAVRHLSVDAGVMVTASHNPPRDNGYKVYLGGPDQGSQIAPPQDSEIAAHIDRVATEPVPGLPRSQAFTVLGPEVLDAYVAETARAFAQDSVPTDAEPLRVAYTAMHGVGAETARRVYAAAGFPEVCPVPEQDAPDGAFPTVSFPNPEEPGALDLAFRTARECDADLIIAHDPDADRLAIALPDADAAEGYRALTGNQLGLLLGWRSAEAHRAVGGTGGALACTIVSSPALGAVAREYGMDYSETLSGFKWVSRVPGLVFGFEEALGYLVNPDLVRDKDGVSASAMVLDLAAELRAEGRTLWDQLDAAAERFGAFESGQLTLRLGGVPEVEAVAARIREEPPTAFGAVAVARLTDLLEPGHSVIPANVLRFDLADGSRVMIRPSGTEPKLKLYLDTFSEQGSAAERRAAAQAALSALTAAAEALIEAVRP